MAAIEDISTTKIPRWLPIVTLVALALRLIMMVLSPSFAADLDCRIPWISLNTLGAPGHTGKKLILYEFRAQWCEQVKRLEETVFTNKEIAETIAGNFIPVKVTDRLKEDGKNQPLINELEKKYHIIAFPTIVVASSDGEAKATLIGNVSALSAIHFLSRVTQSTAHNQQEIRAQEGVSALSR